jgi:lipopolysaccharide/colanic/teichoic acid biosynthesis glycosyltransferase
MEQLVIRTGAGARPDCPLSAGRPEPRRRIYARRVKRGLDILLALLLLAPCLVLIGFFALLVRMDGGPCLFRQERVGLGGRGFGCWKLRTMVVDAEAVLADLCRKDPRVAAEWHLYQKLSHDPRITRVGAFLRATSLDELPQIWNVLRGDMSFVGPRPMLPSQQDLYRQGGGRAYYRLRPGITGPWQVEGRDRGQFLDRVRYDERYIDSMSLVSDLSYVLRTAKVVFRRSGS